MLRASRDATAALDSNREGMDIITVRAVQIVVYPMLDGEVIHRATIRAAPR
jgi:hypothetical protein